MREIRIRFKLARKRSTGGASIYLMYKRWRRFKIPVYWLIYLTYGFYACPHDESEYIKCINHEVMHAVLYELEGDDADFGWDNIVKDNSDGFCYHGKAYGWKNIMGKYLPDVYCEDE